MGIIKKDYKLGKRNSFNRRFSIIKGLYKFGLNILKPGLVKELHSINFHMFTRPYNAMIKHLGLMLIAHSVIIIKG